MRQSALVHMNCDTEERIKGLDSVSGALVNTCVCVCVCVHACVCVYVGGLLVAQLCLTVSPWTIAHQAPLCVEFSWQEYWSFSTGEDAHLQKLGECRHTQNSLKVLWKKQIE